MSDRGSEPAYPGEYRRPLAPGERGPVVKLKSEVTHELVRGTGMSIREAFAMAAMQGLLARGMDDSENASVAGLSVYYTDALLAALQEPPG